ncbi:hypothetical protein [Phenylobacterium sp.]|uniref:hypothetical protein n=1 Tax=Phenylobacterium sp. TaxID=1871053 RepID=UPI0025E8C4B6|nr:hypothetical protein [Phenylobacterium sp.]MBX3482263.1 hypothetical protein [Phenylobacterium sp.]
MTRAVPIAGILAALGAAAPASAADLQAQAAARAVIVEPMAIRMQWATAMPSVRGAVDGAVFSGVMPSMAMGMMMPANARLMIQRRDETGEPATAPGAFDVTTIRNQPAVLVRTGLTADVQVGGRPTLVGGEVRSGTAASIGVARGLVLASTGGQAPGSAGTLVVMVQYN